MLRIRPALILALCSLPLFAGSLSAADGSGPAEPVTTAIEKEPINTLVPIYRAYVNTASDKFSFLIPENFRLGGDPGRGRLQIVDVDSNCFINFNILRSVASDTQESMKTVYREWLTGRFLNGKIVQEYSRPVLGRNALVFDVDWKNGSLAQKTRTVYVQSTAGLIEVTVTTGAKHFRAAEIALNEVIGSLVESVNGKLVVQHLSNAGM